MSISTLPISTAPPRPARQGPGRAALTALLATAAALTAMAPGAQAEAPINVNYRCLGTFDATDLRALFFKGAPSEVVLLTGSTGASRLLQQRSGSGARYADGDEVFWIKGDRATWQRGKARALPCTVSSDSQEPTR